MEVDVVAAVVVDVVDVDVDVDVDDERVGAINRWKEEARRNLEERN